MDVFLLLEKGAADAPVVFGRFVSGSGSSSSFSREVLPNILNILYEEPF
jgi:hypothetical protein